MRLLQVRVTREHIAAGKPGDCRACPVWWGLFDALPAGTRIVVYAYKIWLNGRPYPAPEAVTRFVWDFDRDAMRDRCEPFEFTLEVEDEVFTDAESTVAA